MTIAAKVKIYLDEKRIKYHLQPHTKSYCTKESAATAHIEANHLAKAVILKDDIGYVMMVIPGKNWVDLHAVQKKLKRDMTVAPEESLDTLFSDCQPGAVPAVGPAYKMETMVDNDLSQLSNIYFEGGDHETLVEISGENFSRLMIGSRYGNFSISE